MLSPLTRRNESTLALASIALLLLASVGYSQAPVAGAWLASGTLAHSLVAASLGDAPAEGGLASQGLIPFSLSALASAEEGPAAHEPSEAVGDDRDSEGFADTEAATPEEEKPLFPWGNFAVRGGVFGFMRSDRYDIYGPLPAGGADFKYHIGRLPLAAQTSVDFSGNVEDVSEAAIPSVPTAASATEEFNLFMFAWRLTLLVEPPPGALGNRRGTFWVNPYVGLGFGVHYLTEDVQRTEYAANGRVVSNTISSYSDATIGFHALMGVDFVFRVGKSTALSAGLELMATTTEIDNIGDSSDFGGFLGTVNFKVHF